MSDNTNDISGKVGLDTTDFKAGITTLNQQIKVIDTGFRAAAAGMADWGTSADGLKSRLDALNKMTDLQKKKVAGLREAYEKTVAEKGADSKAARDLEIWINKETMALNKNEKELREVTTKLNEFGKETDQASTKTNHFEGSLGKIGGALKNIGGAVSKAAIAGITAVGTAAVGAAAGAFKMAKETGEAADALITLSNKTGISVERLQEMEYAARFVDVEVETMTGSMVKLTKSMDGARDGGKKQADAFAKLGVKVTDSNGALRDSKQVWAETIDALGGVANETERDALAMELFGKSAQELNPLIKAGSEEMKRLSEEAHAMGAVLSDEAVAEAGKFDDMLQQMDASMKGMSRTVGVAVMPAITEIVKSVTNVVPGIINAIQTGNWAGAAQIISDGIKGILAKATELLPGLAQMGTAILSTIVTALAVAIPDIIPPLIDATLQLLDVLIQTIIDNGPMIIEAGITALLALIDGLVAALPKLMDATLVIIMTLLDGLLKNLPKLVDASIKIILALALGLIAALPKLIEKIPEIITAIVVAIGSNLPQIINAALQIIVALASGLVRAIPQMIVAIPKIITALIAEFKKVDWGKVGTDIMKGIGEGIAKGAKQAVESIKNAASSLLSNAKATLGIKSPSRVFKQQVGLQIGAGMAAGVTESSKMVDRAMAGINQRMVTSVNVTSAGRNAASGSGAVVVNVPLYLDGREITRSTGSIQQGSNKARSRALGVVAG